MSSPALNDKIWNRLNAISDTSRMTVNGTINKTGILLLFMAAGGYLGWNAQSPGLILIAMIAALILSFVIIFGPQRAPYLSQVYAFSEGILIGGISVSYSYVNPGIVSNALFLTMGCAVGLLILYRARIIRVTDRVRSIIVTATVAIALTYMVDLILGLFHVSVPMIHQSTPMGIAFSVVVVGIAALNLLLDFDMIEQAAARNAPKFMEWYCGFALLVTLVWLYLEILRLLSKLSKK